MSSITNWLPQANITTPSTDIKYAWLTGGAEAYVMLVVFSTTVAIQLVLFIAVSITIYRVNLFKFGKFYKDENFYIFSSR